MLGGIRRAPAIVVVVLTSLLIAAALAWAAPGDLDTSFGEGGKVVTDLQPGDSFAAARAVAAQDDDRLVVAGSANTNFGNRDFAVVRYRKNGAIDADFARDGIRIFAFGTNDDQANDVALLPSGKIVVAGLAVNSLGEQGFAVARLTKGGKLDKKFSDDGKLRFTFPGGNGGDQAEGIAIQEDGRMVVVGHSSATGIGDRFAVARLTKNGKLDDTFAGDGRAIVEFPGFLAAQGLDVAIQDNGRLVMSGYASDGEDLDFAIARYRAGGVPDTSFDTDGFQTSDVGGFEDVAYAVGIDADGRIVAAGKARPVSDAGDFGVARYLSDGTPDEDFSGDGFVLQEAGADVVQEEAESLVILPSGAVVVAGVTGPGFASTDFALMRFTEGGVLDTAFSPAGTAGIEVTDFGGTQDAAYGLVRQSSGRLVAAGVGDLDGTFHGFALAGYLGN